MKGPGCNATIPGFWVMAALLAWAIHWRWRGGLVAGRAASRRPTCWSAHDFTQANYGNVFLLVIGGPIVGLPVRLAAAMAAERDGAERAAAAAAERARLARAVHDGCCRCSPWCSAAAPSSAGTAAELGRLAGEQEVALRGLIRQQDALDAPADRRVGDLGAALARLGPARSPCPSRAARRRRGPRPRPSSWRWSRACLDNVAAHVGDDAPAWVLLEDFPDRVVVRCATRGRASRPAGSSEAAARGPARRRASRSAAGSPTSAARAS